MRPIRPATLSLLFVALVASRVRADDSPSLDERVRKLEEQVRQLLAENAELKKAQAPRPTAATVKAAGKESELKLGGFVQVQAEAGGTGDARFSDDNDRVFLRRARVNLTGRFLEDMDFRTELELAGSLAAGTALRAQLTDGYVNWHRYPWMNVKAGQFKTPFGYEQLFSDTKLLTIERSLANDRLTLSRQLGVQLGGDAVDQRFSWAVGAFNGVAMNGSSNDDDRFLLAARLSGTPWKTTWKGRDAHWSVGTGAFRSEDAAVALAADFHLDATPATPAADNVLDGRRRGTSFDTQVAAGRFDLWAEYLATTFDPRDALPHAHFRSAGWYVQASLSTLSDKLQPVLKCEQFDPSDAVRDDKTRTWTAGLNWYIRGNDLRLSADWLRVDRPSSTADDDRLLVRFQLGF